MSQSKRRGGSLSPNGETFVPRGYRIPPFSYRSSALHVKRSEDVLTLIRLGRLESDINSCVRSG